MHSPAQFESRIQPLNIVPPLPDVIKRICDLLGPGMKPLDRQRRVNKKREELRKRIASSNNLPKEDGEIPCREEPLNISIPQESQRFLNNTFDSWLQNGSQSNKSPCEIVNSPCESTFSSNFSAFTPKVRFKDKETELKYNSFHLQRNKKQFYSPDLKEDIGWEINFKRVGNIYDSKMFYFGKVLWRVSFGVNSENPNFYYVMIELAESCPVECRLMCDFTLHGPLISTVDQWTGSPSKASGMVVGDYTEGAGDNYCFYYNAQEEAASTLRNCFGFSKFISRNQISGYLQTNGKLLMTVSLATDVGPRGELIGCREVEPILDCTVPQLNKRSPSNPKNGAWS